MTRNWKDPARVPVQLPNPLQRLLGSGLPYAEASNSELQTVFGAVFQRDRRDPMGTRFFSVNQRRSVRVAPQAATPVLITSNGETHVARLLEAQERGFCATGQHLEGLSGRREVDVRLELPGKSFTGEAVVCRAFRRWGRDVVAFHWLRPFDRRPWNEWLIDTNYPNTCPRSRLPSADVRSLMERSGYAGLRNFSGGTARWCRLSAPGLSEDRVFIGRDGQLVGHISSTRAYANTWVGHQLATNPRHTEALDCWRALYDLAVQVPLMHHGSDPLFVSFYERALPWHRRFFFDYARWLDSPEDAAAFALDRFEIPYASPEYRSYPSLFLRRARDADMGQVCALFADQYPPLLRRALHLGPQSLHPSTQYDGFATYGLERGRDTFVVLCGSTVVGALVSEYASPELSMFGVFSLAHAVCSPGAPADVRRLIVDQFRERRVHRGASFLVAPPGQFRDVTGPGVQWAEEMGAVVFSARGLRHYPNYTRSLIGPVRARLHKWRQRQERPAF